MDNYVGTFKKTDLDVAIRLLNNFRYEVLNGAYDGWGINDNMILCVKQWLENIENGVYSDHK